MPESGIHNLDDVCSRLDELIEAVAQLEKEQKKLRKLIEDVIEGNKTFAVRP